MATLRRLAPGDWRLDEFQWIMVGGETFADVLNLLVEFFVPLLWGTAPFEFPRSRWTGAERTFKDIGTPVCVHELQHQVFKQYRADMGEHLPRALVANPWCCR